MGVLSRVHTRALTYDSLMATAPDVAAAWRGRQSSTGMTVNGDTVLTYSAVWAAVNLISSDVGSLPLFHYKRLDGGGKTRQYGSRLYKLLRYRPNPEMGAMVFRKTLQIHLLLFQAAFAEIERNQMGQAIAFWPIVPSRVRPYRTPSGTLVYAVTNPAGGEVDIPAADMIHLVGASYDGTCAISMVDKARESVGLSLAMEKQGNTFFSNGSTFGGVVEHPMTFTPEGRENFLKSVEGRHQGIEKAHRILLLEENAKWVPSGGVPPQNAQFNETRTFQLDEVARWFQIPPHKLANLVRATFSNIEHLDLDYYKSCLRQWLTLWQEELWAKLIPSLEQNLESIEFLIDAILLGDIQSRYAAYAVGRQWGWLCADDIRERENMNPLPNGQGKIYLVPQNMWPADQVDKMIEAQSSKAKPALPPALTPDPKADDRHVAIVEEIRALGARLELADASIKAAESRAAAADARAVELQTNLTASDAQILEANRAADAQAAVVAHMQLMQVELEERKHSLETQLAEAQTDRQAQIEAARVADEARLAAESEAARLAAEKVAAEDAVRAATLACEQAEASRQAALASVESLTAKETALAAQVTEATERVVTLEAGLAEVTQQRDAAATEVEHTKSSLESSLASALETTRAASEANEALSAQVIDAIAQREAAVAEAARLALEKAAAEDVRRDAEAARESAERALVAATGALDAYRVDVATAQERVESAIRAEAMGTAARQALEAELAEAARLRAEAVTNSETARASLESALETARAEVAEAERIRDARIAAAAEANEAAVARQADVEALSVREAALSAQADERQAVIDRLTTELQVVTGASVADAQAAATLRAQLATMEASQHADSLRTQAAVEALERAVEAFERERSDAIARATDAEQRAEAAETRSQAVEAETAARHAFETESRVRECRKLNSRIVREMRKALERESDKARRHQQTPEKLRAWMETFYEGHSAAMQTELAELVGLHLAFIRSDENELDETRRIVEGHIRESKRQLEAVLAEDPDDLSATVTRLLYRWETERATTVADRLLEQELAYVRRV